MMCRQHTKLRDFCAGVGPLELRSSRPAWTTGDTAKEREMETEREEEEEEEQEEDRRQREEARGQRMRGGRRHGGTTLSPSQQAKI